MDYFEYARYATAERAHDALADMFADGIVCEGEHPRVERRGGKTRSDARPRYYWAIMLPG